jgi:hypothetical protein
VTTIREQLVDQIIDPDAAFNQPPASACSMRTAFARKGSSTILLATAAAIAGRA